MNVLFVCSQNRLRSPTAERVFSGREGIEVRSAGVDPDAVTMVSSPLLEWADLVFVMEATHLKRLRKTFRPQCEGKRIIVLGIPDEYDFMQPELVSLLQALVERHLRSSG